MKSLAHSIVWWFKINKHRANLARNCPGCTQNLNKPTKEIVHLWGWPTAPWQQLHIDYADPYFSNKFLIIVDAYSK